MSVSYWILWLVLCAAAAGLSLWQYRRRETPGRGRTLLAGMRTAALALLLLLLFDPMMPDGGGADGAAGVQVLLDASLSMRLPAGADATAADDARSRWLAAAEAARENAGSRPVLLFGDAVRGASPDALPDSAPGDPRTRLLPALQAAAEAGVRRVVLVTDGRIEDADAVTRWLPRLGLDVDLRLIGDEPSNRALAEVSAPPWVQAGSPARVDFGVSVSGAADAEGTRSPDSVRVVARQGGRVVGRAAVAAPAPGRMATGGMDLRLEPPPGGGWVAVELALEGSDAVADDDARTVYVRVSEEPAGIALVSLRPDWEPRFLAPVLEQAVGLPLRGYLRGATGHYVRLSGGLEAGVQVDEATVREAVAAAELVVVHGLGPDAPQWAVDAASSARRVLILPAGGAMDAPLPMTVGAPVPGDYFPVSAVPASPVARLLTGLDLAGVAPLAALRSVDTVAGAWAPLYATRGRQGAPLPLALAGQEAGRRWVVALGDGYWQWSFRGGADRDLYVRMWSALAGWLTQDGGTMAGSAVRPAGMVVPRAGPVPWVAPGLAADSIAITITTADDDVVADTVVGMAAGDTAYTGGLPPGAYSWRALAFGADTTSAEGRFTVERYSPELAHPRVDPATFTAAAEPVRGAAARRGGTPLHSSPWPYLLLVGLLAGEWVLRRRWGLR